MYFSENLDILKLVIFWNAGLCTSEGVVPGTNINWEWSSWRTALQQGTWGCWSAAGSVWASSVAWHLGVQITSWGASNRAEPAGFCIGLFNQIFKNGVLRPMYEILCTVVHMSVLHIMYRCHTYKLCERIQKWYYWLHIHRVICFTLKSQLLFFTDRLFTFLRWHSSL